MQTSDSIKDAIAKIKKSNSTIQLTILYTRMHADPDSRFPVSECKNNERLGFYFNFKIQKRQLVRGTINPEHENTHKTQAKHPHVRESSGA
jgi:hypothetical protein